MPLCLSSGARLVLDLAALVSVASPALAAPIQRFNCGPAEVRVTVVNAGEAARDGRYEGLIEVQHAGVSTLLRYRDGVDFIGATCVSLPGKPPRIAFQAYCGGSACRDRDNWGVVDPDTLRVLLVPSEKNREEAARLLGEPLPSVPMRTLASSGQDAASDGLPRQPSEPLKRDQAGLQVFRTAEPQKPASGDPTQFAFSVGDRNCTVSHKGLGRCAGPGAAAWRFEVPAHKARITALYVHVMGAELFMAYELSDDEASWGQLIRLRPGKGQPLWRVPVRGLNLAAPVQRDGDVYLAALAFVARVDGRSGRPVWRLERGYDGGGRVLSELDLVGDLVLVRTLDPSNRASVRVECLAADLGVSMRCPQLPE